MQMAVRHRTEPRAPAFPESRVVCKETTSVSRRVMSTTLKTAPSATFAPRPSTNVPPATQTFEPLAKSVLTHRLLYNVFTYSAAFSLASTIFLAGGDDASFILRLFRPVTWVNASLTWLVGVLPIIVVRKVFLART